jgi:hypothetical protein
MSAESARIRDLDTAVPTRIDPLRWDAPAAPSKRRRVAKIALMLFAMAVTLVWTAFLCQLLVFLVRGFF